MSLSIPALAMASYTFLSCVGSLPSAAQDAKQGVPAVGPCGFCILHPAPVALFRCVCTICCCIVSDGVPPQPGPHCTTVKLVCARHCVASALRQDHTHCVGGGRRGGEVGKVPAAKDGRGRREGSFFRRIRLCCATASTKETAKRGRFGSVLPCRSSPL